MNTTAVPPTASTRIDIASQFSLFFHFLLLSFTTTTLLMGVMISEESIFLGLFGLFFLGIAQLLSAFVGAMQYGRLWQAVHLMAAVCFIGVQVGGITLLAEVNLSSVPDFFFWTWVVGNIVVSLAAGWSYWFNLRSSYAREAAIRAERSERTMV